MPSNGTKIPNTIDILFWTGEEEYDALGKEKDPLITEPGVHMVHITYEDGDKGIKSERFYVFYVYPSNPMVEGLIFAMNWGRIIYSAVNFVFTVVSMGQFASAKLAAKEVGEEAVEEVAEHWLKRYIKKAIGWSIKGTSGTTNKKLAVLRLILLGTHLTTPLWLPLLEEMLPGSSTYAGYALVATSFIM